MRYTQSEKMEIIRLVRGSQLAVASVFSQIRGISVPLGMKDPNHPNLSLTLWRTVANHGKKVFYFDSATMPAVCWVDLKKVDLKKGASARTIAIDPEMALAGEVSAKFALAEPIKW